MGACVGALSPEQVTTAFLAATPYISKQILDLTAKRPNFPIELPEMIKMDPGEGSTIEQLVFRASFPEVERGLNKWALQSNNSGCTPCDGPDCSYHWTMFPASAWERKRTALMERQFRTPSYCVKDIQTTKDYEVVFGKIVETMYLQTQYFKEQNITMNIFTSLAKKYVVDQTGPVPNTQNPYVYRNIGTATLGALNIFLLEVFYEEMRRMPDVLEFDMVDGAPLYAMMCSQQLISHMYRDDPSLRQDARFSGAANNLLSKYNFQSTIRGMFIPAPILYPRRFTTDADDNLVEVLPLINGIPAEVGTFTGLNPEYGTAPYEEVLLCGRNPFKLAWRPTVQSLGAGTDFGPEPGFMDYWVWINPQTFQDPFRRVGYFATSISLGVLPQYSEGIFGIVVSRPNVALAAAYNCVPQCPPVAPTCTNTVPEVDCPCSLILSVTANPITAGSYFIVLAAPLEASVDPTEVVALGVNSGGYVNATVVAISTDRKTFSATITGLDDICTDTFTTLFCDSTLGCYADVLSYNINCTDATRVNLVLSNNIRATTNGVVVTLYYGDGTSISATSVGAANQLTNSYVFDIGATAFCDQVGGIVGVCVTSDATCDCNCDPVVTQCEPPEEEE